MSGVEVLFSEKNFRKDSEASVLEMFNNIKSCIIFCISDMYYLYMILLCSIRIMIEHVHGEIKGLHDVYHYLRHDRR